ncbi:MAG: serine protease [Candidatus Liberibacter europaeus]|uniref:Serine protease n=1 Tax=Candidatus Liberibacter europaeus TaxID=744859 RepID=A0A2T4VXM6_9HYPH|nr:serine protease [Candidatus Liberibacter europaeus]PTL86518.1 MAG: serine protease [Candidatus Liberibacter europaeus]
MLKIHISFGRILSVIVSACVVLSGICSISEAKSVSSADISPVVKRVSSSVVSVVVTKKEPSAMEFKNWPDNSVMKKFFRIHSRESGDNFRNNYTVGSGFFISEDGYIVTNNHVVEDGASFTVFVEDGEYMPAELIGRDAITDLAVLKVTSKKKFRPVEFESTYNIFVGETVFTIGSPAGLQGTVSSGIISSFKRADFSRNLNGNSFIQIDASIGSGSSGGACFNVKGRVVGMSSFIYSNPSGHGTFGFIIQPSVIQQVVPYLIKKGKVDRGWAGFFVQELTQELAIPLGLKDVNGVIITYVSKDSPSDKVGLKRGDVVCAINGKVIKDAQDFIFSVRSYLPKDKVEFSLCRQGEKRSVSLVLENGSVYAMNLDPKILQKSEKILGLTLQNVVYEDKKMVRIVDLKPNSEAEMKGIEIGMYINSINGAQVYSVDDVKNLLNESKAKNNHSVVLLVQNNPDINNTLYNSSLRRDWFIPLNLVD